jgi:ABC-2 type transport system ATP-binding protein
MSLSVQAEGITQRFGETLALDEVSFSLEPGKIYGLLGRNGSGKSTLLAILAAFMKSTGGCARVGGEPVFENARITREVCLIREAGDTVASDESVGEAIEFAASIRPHWDGAYAAELLRRFGLETKKKLGALSRGQLSALGITLGLASRAPLTMFDESYLGLDAPSRYLFYDELLADFIRHPRTMIISTHLIEEVSKLFEEVVIIDKGRLLLHEPLDALLSHGATLTGSAEAVDQLASGLRTLSSRQLGPTKSVTVFGQLSREQTAAADHAGVEISPVPLQDLFVHLTGQPAEETS